MKCTNCRKDIKFLERVYRNLESYRPGGIILAASECCGKGYLVKMNINYTTTEYKGDDKTDAWGTKLNKNEEIHTRRI